MVSAGPPAMPDVALPPEAEALIDCTVIARTNRVLEQMLDGPLAGTSMLDSVASFATFVRSDLRRDLLRLNADIDVVTDGLRIWNRLPGADTLPPPGVHAVADLARDVARDLVIAGLPVLAAPDDLSSAGFAVWPVVDADDEPDGVVIDWHHHPAASMLRPHCELQELSRASKRHAVEMLRCLGYVVADTHGVITVERRG